MAQYRIRNWERFQHYKKRNPPWIKLHGDLLASRDWVTLADASRVLAVACMLLAAREGTDGEFTGDPEYIQRVAYLNSPPDFLPLVKCGFLENLENTLADASTLQADASTLLAIACTETEGEGEAEKEGEGEADVQARPPDPIPWKTIESTWNQTAEETSGDKIRTVTDRRKKQLRPLVRDFGLEDVLEVFQARKKSKFLRGESGGESWKGHGGAQFDFFCNRENFTKTLEGKYEDKKQTKPCGNANSATGSFHPDDVSEFSGHPEWEEYVEFILTTSPFDDIVRFETWLAQ